MAFLLALLLALTPHGVPARGVASWYDATYHPKGKQTTWYTRKGVEFYAAVGSFRWGDHPYYLLICRQDDASRCVVVQVVDHCARCKNDLRKPWSSNSRAIDLSPRAFRRLEDLHRGLVGITIREVLSGPR